MSSAPRGSPRGRRTDSASPATRSAAVQSSRARSTSAGSSGSVRSRLCTVVNSTSIFSRTARYAAGSRGSPSSTKASSGVPASTSNRRSRWIGSICSRWRAATSCNDAVTPRLSRYPVRAEAARGTIAIVMPSAIQDRRDRSFQPRTFTMRYASRVDAVDRTRGSGWSASDALPAQLLQRRVPDPVELPVLVVEVPPLRVVHREALGFHGLPEHLPVPALPRGPAGVGGIGAVRHLVVDPRHLDGAPGLEIVERQVHGAATVVAGAGRGIGDELVLGGRGRVPEHLGHVPGPVGIVDQETEPLRPELPVGPYHRLRGRALHERPRLAVERRAQEVPRGGVADVEPDGGVEPDQLDQVRFAELPGLGRRRGRERLPPELLHRAGRHDPEDRALLGAQGPAGPGRIPDLDGDRPAAWPAPEADLRVIPRARRAPA